MARTIILYAIALALALAALEWLETRYAVRAVSPALYVGILAATKTTHNNKTNQHQTPHTTVGPFERNDAAIRALGLTPRECELLDLLASGSSNKALARALNISPNTVKTHIARLYEKLGVDRRIRAIEEARALALIPREGRPSG